MPGKAKVTVCGTYRSVDKKVVDFKDASLFIPDNKAHIAKSEVRGLMKKHLSKFFPDAKSLRTLDVTNIESESLNSLGKPVDVMNLEELIYVIQDKDMSIKVEEFPSLSELRHAVKLYLTDEDEALAYIKAKRQEYREERELMELNPNLVKNSSTYLDPATIKEAKKVKVQKPPKNLYKVETQDLDTDSADTDLNGSSIGANNNAGDQPDPETVRKNLLAEAKALGLKPNANTGIEKLKAMIESQKENDEI